MLNNNLKNELFTYDNVGASAKNHLLYWYPQTHTKEETVAFYKEVSKRNSDRDIHVDVNHYIDTTTKMFKNEKVFAEICEECGFHYNVLIKNAQAATFTVEVPFDKSAVEKRRISFEIVYDTTPYTDEMFLYDIKRLVQKDRNKTRIHYININALLNTIEDYLIKHNYGTGSPCIRIVK